MKKTRFTEVQILNILNEFDAGKHPGPVSGTWSIKGYDLQLES